MVIRSNLPIKYYLNLHNEEDLQDNLSILFDIMQYLIKVAQMKSKDVSPDIFKFSSKSLKYVFGDKIKDETFKSNLVKTIKELISTEHLLVDGENIKITIKGIAEFYTI